MAQAQTGPSQSPQSTRLQPHQAAPALGKSAISPPEAAPSLHSPAPKPGLELSARDAVNSGSATGNAATTPIGARPMHPGDTRINEIPTQGRKRAVALPVQTQPPSPKPRPQDGEYLPDDFFAQLQSEPGQDMWEFEMAPAPKDPHRPEIRGVWLTTSDMEIWRDRNSLQQAIRQLAKLNFNTIYPVVWTRGYVTYPSSVAEAAGIPQLVRGMQNQDLLTDLIEQAHAQEIAVIPWFEYGFMVPPQSELALLHPDWLTEKRNGQQTELSSSKAMAWLNPFQPEVQRLMRGLAVDLVSQYNVDGIQFDDHMGLPKAFGYDELTRSRYEAETGQAAPSRATNPQWTQWRANQITYGLVDLHRAIKSINPKLVFSVSPNRADYAYRHYLQDWKTWIKRGIVDELIVQAYRSNHGDFLADLKRPEIRAAQQHIPTGIGILTGLSDRRVSMYRIKQQVRAAQAQGLGVSFFFYQSLWDNAPESIAERKSGFRSIFPESVPRIAARL